MSDDGGDGLRAARALLPGARLESLELLLGSARSEVRRVRLHRDGEQPQTVVVKSFASAGEGWMRETAALAVLPEGVPAPRLLLAGAEPPIAVLTDLGSGPSVADALLGDDPGVAEEIVCRWAEALAGFHASTRGLRERFAAALAKEAGELPVAAETMATAMSDLARTVDDWCASLGVATSSAALDELRGLGRRLHGDGAAALTPADACPDNNVRVDDRVVLLDFEGAQWRHVAWDLAYLRVPWPTCWCSWRLPDHVADAALQRYRGASGFEVTDADIDAAALGWAFVAVDWFLDRALGDDPPLNPDRPTPTRRAMILHRLGIASGNTDLPAAADLAARLRVELVRRWGEVELAYAPAFS